MAAVLAAAIALVTPVAALAAGPEVTPAGVTWTFGKDSSTDEQWTAERGRIAVEGAALMLRPDTSRRVLLVSPASVPAEVRGARSFLVAVDGTGLQRVRIQGRRDARGGWITLADASSKALKQTADGVVVARKAGVLDAPIERLRIELVFRTTNPRPLTRVAALRQ